MYTNFNQNLREIGSLAPDLKKSPWTEIEIKLNEGRVRQFRRVLAKAADF